jgi:hypothetical protein
MRENHGSNPVVVKTILVSGMVVNSTRDEKELSRIKKELNQTKSWSSGKDKVLRMCEARINSWLCRKHFKVRHGC